MMHYLKRFFIIPLLFLSLSSFVIFNAYKTSGGHPSSTGAPGENTCADAVSGCHANAAVKKDTTNLVNTLLFSSPDSSYNSNTTYTITISAAKSGISKFGFEIVALDASNKNAGTWTITDGTRTHIITGSGSNTGRKYVTHSTAGTPEVSSGLGQWTFKWNAPAVNVGNITFYYATNCTNSNNAATGDQLFLSSFKIHPSKLTAAPKEIADRAKLKVQYSAAEQEIELRYNLAQNAEVSLSLVDVQGKTVYKGAPVKKFAGSISETIPLGTGLSDGIYFVNLNIGNQTVTEKIVVSAQ